MAHDAKTDDVVRSHLDLEERIRRRAHEIYRSHGKSGTELDDWLAAEREILGASGAETQGRATTVGKAGRPDHYAIEELGEA